MKPLWKYANMRHKSSRLFKKQVQKKQVVLKTVMWNFTELKHVLHYVPCPRPGRRTPGTGETSRITPCEECVSRRKGAREK